MPKAPAPGRGERVDVTDLRAAWSPRQLALGPLDLHLAAGEALTITGPNGCGRSTLLAVPARQLDPLDGSCLLGGRDALAAALEQTRARVPSTTNRT